MQTFYADLHVHIGRSGTRPVKMAASPRLTLPAIIEEAAERKGIHIVGIVDALADPVFAELRTSVAGRALEELSGGGLQAPARPGPALKLSARAGRACPDRPS